MNPSITETQVLAAIRAFLVANLPTGGAVIKGQANLVPEPKVNDFVIMTPNRRSRLGMTIDIPNPDNNGIDHTEPMQIDLQLDFHGETSTDNATTIQILFRDGYAYDFLIPYGVSPLYCDDGQQMPFINDQDQYEDRWVMTMSMQVNPTVSTPQQFAEALAIELAEVDITPPAIAP